MEAGVDLLVLETFRDSNEIREAILAAREAAGNDMVIMAQLSIEDDGTLRDGTSTADFTQQTERMAGRRDRPELLLGSQSDARDHREDGRLHDQAAERDAQRRTADHGRGPQPVSVLARIHGAICAPLPARRREDRRRMLRNHGRAHQGNAIRGAQPATRAACALGGDRRAGHAVPRRSKRFRSRKKARWERSWRRSSLSRLSRSCRRAAWTRPRRSKARSCARPRESIASTSRMVLAPALG